MVAEHEVLEEEGGADSGLLRINVRKGASGVVTFVNNIEKDPEYARLPTDMSALLQPSYGLPQVRKNLFNLVLVLDPTSLSMKAYSCFKQFYQKEAKERTPLIVGERVTDPGVQFMQRVAFE